MMPTQNSHLFYAVRDHKATFFTLVEMLFYARIEYSTTGHWAKQFFMDRFVDRFLDRLGND